MKGLEMKINLFGYTINITKELDTKEDMPQDLREAIETIKRYGVKAGSSEKQRAAAKKATETRQQRTKRKIEDAINLLRLEGKNITEYAIAKQSGCSINTVKKYRDFIKSQNAI